MRIFSAAPRARFALLFLALVSQPVLAQTPPFSPSIGKSRAPTPYERKVDYFVRNAVARMKADGITHANAHGRDVRQRFSHRLLKVDDSARIHLYLHLREVDDASLDALTQAGVEIELANPELKLVQGWAPYEQIDALAALDLVTRIRPPEYAYVQSGSYTSQGDSILKANLVRSQLGITGSGVKVGVISDGANNYSQAQASGDLPASVTVFGSCDPNTRGTSCNEGTAMMEIVYDLAPGATLAMGDVNTSAEFVQRVTDLTNWGAKVIVDDLGFFGEPFFQDGSVATAYTNALAQGVVVVSAAGNQAQVHYQGAFTDTDANSWHEFSPGDETINFQVGPGASALVILQWTNPFGGSGDDYDLLIWDSTVTSVVGSGGQDAQTGFDDPIEFSEVTCYDFVPCTFHASVFRYAGNAQTLELFFLGGTPSEHIVTADSLFGQASVPGAIAAAAISASNSGNLTAESYSSRGPSTIAFPSLVQRATPTITTIDCVSVSGVGGFGSPFCGTSAAAPHAAAVAALLLQAKPSLTPSQVKNAMQSTAADRGAAGYDNTYGSGLVDALAAVNSVLPNPTITSISPTSAGTGTFSLTVNGGIFNTATAQIVINGPGCAPCTIANASLTTKTTTSIAGPATIGSAGTFTVQVQNGSGGLSNSATLSVSGGGGAPSVTTGAASSISSTGASVSATVNPNGVSTTLFFDYGTTTSYGNTVTYGSAGSGSIGVTLSYPLGGLACATTYQFRARAQNSNGTTNGLNQSFTTSACGAHKVRNDFNADSKSDLLWRNTSNGDIWLWLMNANTINGGGYVANLPSSFAAAATGDFNNDSKADIVWRNNANGDVWLWLMNGNAIAGGGYVANLPAALVPAGTGDFNNDGKADILWRNTSTGDIWLWLMNGNTIIGGGYVANLPASFVAAGVADFNNDGKADILWRNNANGDVWLWLMNGNSIAGGGYVANLPASFVTAGTGDFNNDGKADILWRNNANGDIWLWLMNGNTINGGGYVANLPSSFVTAAVGDYNADGKADIVWRNNANGDVWLWLMNGNTINGGGYVANLPATLTAVNPL